MEHHNKSKLFLTLTALLVTFLAGCANEYSIYRADPLRVDKPHVVTVDAKQRMLLTSPNMGKSPDTTETLLRFCAEPPPDVFTALATSLAAEASVSKSTAPEASAKLAASISENAATIERTQTVNILREAMYRNCERYLSGAITDQEFIVQAARDQQLIVQVLAVEQITGVARAQSTALTTVAKAAASGVSDAGLATLSEAKKDVDSKRVVAKEAATEAAALAPAGPCGDSPIDEEEPPEGVTAEQAKAKNGKCKDADSAAGLVKEAEEYFELIKKTIAKQGTVSSEAQGQLATAALTATEASVEIAEKVVEIVRQYQAFDEIGMTCVVKLRTQTDLKEETFCHKLLKQMADTRYAQLKLQEQRLSLDEQRLNEERVREFRSAFDATSQSMAEQVWTKLGENFKPSQLNELAAEAGVTLANVHKKRLTDANADFPDFLEAFKKLSSDRQEKLAEAALKQ